MRIPLLVATLVAALWAAAAHGQEPEPCRAARELAGRLLGPRAEEFVFRSIPAEAGADVFEVSASGGRVVIGGNTGVSMASGLNWYLRHACHAEVSLYGVQLQLPTPLPDLAPVVRRVSPHRYRYLLNYCCFGYSLAWWDWPQWERLIDWMALNGINMPLAVTGQEAVWEAVGRRLGLRDAEMREFLPGPPYLPFGWMGCLDGWGGPLPRAWSREQAKLERRILARERGLGMTPVLQGFTGHVPQTLTRVLPGARLEPITWMGFQTFVLDPASEEFQEVGRLFLEEQTRLYGTDHLYASDTFIEMTPPSGDPAYLAGLSRAVLGAMTAVDPEARWVLQGWIFLPHSPFWTPERTRALFDAVPDDRVIVLDLFCESSPAWRDTKAFYGKPWLWCIVQSFGRRVLLEGNLPLLNEAIPAAYASPERGKLSGIGVVCEGLDYNPVVFDFMGEAAWRAEPVDLEAWIDEYAERRYGSAPEPVREAWRTLLATVYSGNAVSASDICTRPILEPARGASYDCAALLEAWRGLLLGAPTLAASDPYRFDVVNVGRQVLSNLAPRYHADVASAFRRGDRAAMEAAADRYLALLRDIDRLLATREEFLLGRELEEAKRWGGTPAERARCEWNARTVISLWTGTYEVNDYAHKEWSGLLTSLQFRRWEVLLDHLHRALDEHRDLDLRAYVRDVWAAEKAWTEGSEVYPAQAHGDSVTVARELFRKYRTSFGRDAVSLTTGRPVSCSDSLPGWGPELANDGVAWNTNQYWAVDVADGKPAWWQVDLEAPTSVGRVTVVGYYADTRSYGFTVEGSLDGAAWTMLADRRANREPATREGVVCDFPPATVRFLRVTETANTANTGRHLVEVMAYPGAPE